MASTLEIRIAEPEDIYTIGYLAQQIWPIAYRDILSKQQLQYMLALLYSPDALKTQMAKQHVFLLAELDEDPVAFASYSVIAPASYKLHKLYVLPYLQGKGIGKALIDFILEEITPLGAERLILNVNRDNQARIFYEKLGFRVTGEEDVDIGNGYFMNDYVMEKEV